MKTASLFALIVLFCLVILGVQAQGKKKQSKFDKFQRKRKDECTQKVCGHIPKDLNDNCVNQCFSVTCFDKFYRESPLEDGEYDARRQRLYQDCAREEFAACSKNTTSEACPQHLADYLAANEPKIPKEIF